MIKKYLAPICAYAILIGEGSDEKNGGSKEEYLDARA